MKLDALPIATLPISGFATRRIPVMGDPHHKAGVITTITDHLLFSHCESAVMFATVSRARPSHLQRERDTGPSEEQRSRGVDSCYGVKSLMSDWDGESEPDALDELVGAHGDSVEDQVEFTPTVERRSLAAVDARLGGDVPTGSSPSPSTARESVADQSVPSSEYIPLSFASLSSHAHSHDLFSEPSSPASYTSVPTSSYLSASISSLSRSSSPTGSSFDLAHRTSGRGYSRAHASSSLAQSAQLGNSYQSHGHDASLVLPSMSLPSSSLHLSISLLPSPCHVTVPERGILTLLLVGAQAHTSRLVRELADETRVKLFDLQIAAGRTREIGVFKNETGLASGALDDQQGIEQRKMLARLRVLNVESDGVASVHTVIKDTFQPLHRLLHPDPEIGSPADHQLLTTLVEKWAGDQRRKINDGYGAWLDMAIFAADALDPDDDLVLESLALGLPTMLSTATTIDSSRAPLFSIPVSITEENPAPELPTPASWADPTPRCNLGQDADGYFSSLPQTPSSTGSSRPAGTSIITCARLVDILLGEDTTCTSEIHHASARAFLSWRQRPLRSHTPTLDLSSSQTSAATATSLESGQGPMPTLARAQGGGEWEAGLSRRVAARRQSEMRRSRSFRPYHGRGLELFPRGLPSVRSGCRLSNLISSIFYPYTFLSRALSTPHSGSNDDPNGKNRRGWTRVVVACAVGVVLCGFGYWCVR